jgi:hypothetical protein
MPRSFAVPPGAALRGGNVVELWRHFDPPASRQPSIRLIRNVVSALCAPFAGASVRMQDQAISVRGSGLFGIDIGICLQENACTLWLGGWHEEMPDVDLALEYVARAIDGRLRLKVLCAGHHPREWIVECLGDDGTWIGEAFTCGVRMLWSRPETVIYLRNEFGAAPAPSA